MKLSKFFGIVATLLVVILLSACSQSEHVASNSLIQKRKYRNGFHLNASDFFNKHKSSEAQIAGQLNEDEINIAQSKSDRSAKQIASSTDEKIIIIDTIVEVKKQNVIQRMIADVKEGANAKMKPSRTEETAKKKLITSRYHRGGKIAFVMAVIYVLAQVAAMITAFALLITIPIAVHIAIAAFGLITLFYALANLKRSDWAKRALLLIILGYIALNLLWLAFYGFGFLEMPF